MLSKIIRFVLLLLLVAIFALSNVFSQEVNDYQSVIKSADTYYQDKDYYNAKASYQLASKLKPEEQYPKDKIQEIIDILKAEMAVRGEYDGYIETADEAFKVKNYSLAIEYYQKALALISYEKYPNKQLEEAKKLLKAASNKKAAYEEAIKKADQYFSKQEYETALSLYRDASNVDETQKYPNDQILKISGILKNQAQNQQAYEDAILNADQQLNYQKFGEALVLYQDALKYIPTDSYAKAQVEKMKDFIEKEKEYDRITELADKLYVEKDLKAAKAEYQKAMDVLPEKTYALNMMTKIDDIFGDQLKEQEKLEAAYKKAIADGDALFNQGKYQSAYSKYAKALDLKPNEEYPQRQLEEIGILLATGFLEFNFFIHENNKGLFDARIQLSESGKVIETAEIGTNGKHDLKLELNKKYQIRVYKDDYVQKIFDVNTALPRDANHNNIYTAELPVELFPDCGADLSILNEALVEFKYFTEKGNFYFDEAYAEIVLNKVNNLKLECEKLQKEQKQKEKFDALVADADKKFDQEKYTESMTAYTAALSIYPDEVYPKERLEQINLILAQADKYQALLASGDAKYNNKDYENALYDYYEAQNLKPEETYPKQKIDEIDALLAAIKALDDKYNAQLKEADSLYNLDSLLFAKDAYVLALEIKKEAPYPKKQIDIINNELDRRKEIDKRYQNAIKEADELFESDNLSDAKAAYVVASQIKPDELYPKYKIEDINTIEEQRKLKAIQNDYEQLISEADTEFENENYIPSKDLYARASEIKPNETYPPAQIEIINRLLKEIEEANNQYSQLIALADQEFDAKSYQSSFENYKSASTIKPEEQYPKERMAAIEEILKNIADNNAAYEEVIQQADEQFSLQNWTDAATFYQQAAQLKPEEIYPPEKLLEIENILKELENKQQAYANAIQQADSNFELEEWQTSKTFYESALSIKPDESYPKDQIQIIDQKLAELGQIQAQYDALIAKGDQLFEEQSYENSRSSFEKAALLKSEETYPPQKINEIDAILNALLEKDAAYNSFIEKADVYFAESQWDMSKTAYLNALEIKPNEQYPKDQIALIDINLKNIADKEAQYNSLIAEGDAMFIQKAYQESKGKYSEALLVFSDEQYPKDKIAEIDALLKSIADIEAQYLLLIKNADQQFESEDYNQSLSSYKEALAIKPEETYPKERIAEIESIIQKLAEQDRLYSEAISQADQNRDIEAWEAAIEKYQEALEIKPMQAYPQEQIDIIKARMSDLAELQAKYDLAIAKADKEYQSQEWSASLTSYQQALDIKPNEVYPQSQIQEITNILKGIADAEAAYQQAINDADNFYGLKDWQAALTKYELALSIKPNEQYPKDRIGELQNLLGELATQKAKYDAFVEEGDGFFNNKNYTSAIAAYTAALEILPQESYPRDQILKIDEILSTLAENQKKYDDLILQADQLFTSREWQGALQKYQEALNIKPEEIYPKEQINRINEELELSAAAEQNYSSLIAEADQLFESSNYENSFAKYELASKIFTEREYPREQMARIKNLLSDMAQKNANYNQYIAKADEFLLQKVYLDAKENYEKALNIFNEKEYPRDQIVKIDEILSKQLKYKDLVGKGDVQFENREYENALQSFNSARSLFPEEQYPPKKIAEIEEILKDLETKRSSYDEAVALADKNFSNSEFEEAKSNYQAALNIISTEVYPHQKIMEIDQILADIARRRVQYDKVIAQADNEFDEQRYDLALTKYNEAMSILPKEIYPQQRIEEINGILAQMANKQERYESLIAQGDQAFSSEEYAMSIDLFKQALVLFPNETYPPKRIAEAEDILFRLQKEIDVAYQKEITKGDRAFDRKTWDDAKTAYLKASEIKPEELYPREKLAEINKIQEDALKELQDTYDRHIADGERFYSTKYYQESILSFERALGVFPDEKYPVEMIDKIYEMIKKGSMLTLLDGKMKLIKDIEKKYKFDPIAYKDRADNYVLLEVKRINPEANVKLFVNFGKGNVKNGGYSIPLKARDGYHSYFVSIGQQTRWVRDDNNYISILPEGGDIEVKVIKVIKEGI
jgi:tetratricopeptide (TPR) repeat protein